MSSVNLPWLPGLLEQFAAPVQYIAADIGIGRVWAVPHARPSLRFCRDLRYDVCTLTYVEALAKALKGEYPMEQTRVRLRSAFLACVLLFFSGRVAFAQSHSLQEACRDAQEVLRLKRNLGYHPCITFSLLREEAPAQQSQFPTDPLVAWPSAPSSDAAFIHGRFVEYLSANGLYVSASLRDTGWKMRADILVTNRTDHKVTVFPNSLTLRVTEPESMAKALPYEEPAKLAKSIERRAAWSSALEQMGAVLQEQEITSQSTVTGDVNAQIETTTRVPDYAAQQRAAERTARNTQSTLDYLSSIVMRPHTLLPGESVFGAAFFARAKKFGIILLRVPVEETVFQFEFDGPEFYRRHIK